MAINPWLLRFIYYINCHYIESSMFVCTVITHKIGSFLDHYCTIPRQHYEAIDLNGLFDIVYSRYWGESGKYIHVLVL